MAESNASYVKYCIRCGRWIYLLENELCNRCHKMESDAWAIFKPFKDGAGEFDSAASKRLDLPLTFMKEANKYRGGNKILVEMFETEAYSVRDRAIRHARDEVYRLRA